MKTLSFINGWRARVAPRKWFLLMLLLSTEQILATDDEQANDFLALIEYLGEWQTDDGEWIDPDDLSLDLEILDMKPVQKGADNE